MHLCPPCLRLLSALIRCFCGCWLCLLLIPLWESVIVQCFVVRYFMSILVLQSSWWGRESWSLRLLVFLVSCNGCVALPLGVMGLLAVCDCGISWSYSLIIFCCLDIHWNYLLYRTFYTLLLTSLIARNNLQLFLKISQFHFLYVHVMIILKVKCHLRVACVLLQNSLCALFSCVVLHLLMFSFMTIHDKLHLIHTIPQTVYDSDVR